MGLLLNKLKKECKTQQELEKIELLEVNLFILGYNVTDENDDEFHISFYKDGESKFYVYFHEDEDGYYEDKEKKYSIRVENKEYLFKLQRYGLQKTLKILNCFDLIDIIQKII
ncbi:hypothetical protein D3C87_80930 [compost metagenome]